MRLYLFESDAGEKRWVGTQAEAAALLKNVRAAGGEGGWFVVDVPTDKPGLLAFLQKWMGGEGEDRPAGGAPASAQEEPAADAVDLILDCPPDKFGPLLEAAITRAGEIGQPAFAHMRALVGRPGASIERGLRFLALAQLQELA